MIYYTINTNYKNREWADIKVCRTSDKDHRNAIPSWSGYQYQGQIAIITALIELCRIGRNSDEIGKYELALEDVEDFSIYKEGKRNSIHQVKAEKKTQISSYSEALYYMAKGLSDPGMPQSVIAYLHTSEELNDSDWNADVAEEVGKFVPAKQKELQNLIENQKSLEEKVTKLQEEFTNSGRIDRKKGPTWNQIYDSMDIKALEDINCMSLERAITNYLSQIPAVDIQRFTSKNRILLYSYLNGQSHIAVTDTETYIEELICTYWGAETSGQRQASLPTYRWRLQELICRNVEETHANGGVTDRIPFSVFANELERGITISEEQRILENKDLFFRWRKNYCEENCENNEACEDCELYHKIEDFMKLSNEEIKNAFYMMSPDVTDDISKGTAMLIREDAMLYSVFNTLSKAQGAKLDSIKRLLYECGKRYLLTDIEISEGNKQKVYRNMSKNEALEKVCEKLLNNREFALQRMEIDSLIVYNAQGETEIKNIEDLRPDSGKLKGMRDESDVGKKEPSYHKITQKKKISLINSKKFVKDQGGK